MPSSLRVGRHVATNQLAGGQSCDPRSMFWCHLKPVIYLKACDKKNYGAVPCQLVGGIGEKGLFYLQVLNSYVRTHYWRFIHLAIFATIITN